MKEIKSEKYKKIADLKTSPAVPHSDSMSKEKSDSKKNNGRKKKKKKLYQVNRMVEDIDINTIRE